MKLAVIGSRSITRANVGKLIPAAWRPKITEIVTGGAIGIDALAAGYARKAGFKLTEILPDFATFKRKAPLVRNAQIVESADAVLAIHDGYSKGTLHTISTAHRAGKPVHVVTIGEVRT